MSEFSKTYIGWSNKILFFGNIIRYLHNCDNNYYMQYGHMDYNISIFDRTLQSYNIY